MRAHHLRVEESEPPVVERLRQVGERAFRRVALPGKHGFSCVEAAQSHAVETADQLPALSVPDLDTVRETKLVKLEKASRERTRDPGPLVAIRAALHDLGERLVERDAELSSLHRAAHRRAPPRRVREREHRARIGGAPGNRPRRHRPWEDPAPVGREERARSEVAAHADDASSVVTGAGIGEKKTRGRWLLRQGARARLLGGAHGGGRVLCGSGGRAVAVRLTSTTLT